MPRIYGNVRSLAGGILTGLGPVSNYVQRELDGQADRISWLSQRYPEASLPVLASMAAWTQEATDAGDAITSGQSPLVPLIPDDYPLVPSTYHYHVQAITNATGKSGRDVAFYPLLKSRNLMSLPDITTNIGVVVETALEKSSGLSPGAVSAKYKGYGKVKVMSFWLE